MKMLPSKKRYKVIMEGKGWRFIFSEVMRVYYMWILGHTLRDWPREYDNYPQYTTAELNLLKDTDDNTRFDKRSADCVKCKFNEGWGDEEKCTINHKQFVHSVKTLFPGSKIVA